MDLKQRGLVFGAFIGAILGAGVAYLLITAPSGEHDTPPKPLAAKDLLGVTGAAAVLVRKFDDIRRRT